MEPIKPQVPPGPAFEQVSVHQDLQAIQPIIVRCPSCFVSGEPVFSSVAQGKDLAKRKVNDGSSLRFSSSQQLLSASAVAGASGHNQTASAVLHAGVEVEQPDQGISSVTYLEVVAVESGIKKITWDAIRSLNADELLELFKQHGAAKNGNDRITPAIYDQAGNEVELSYEDKETLFSAHRRLHAEIQSKSAEDNKGILDKAGLSFQKVAEACHETWKDIKTKAEHTLSKKEIKTLQALHHSGQPTFLKKKNHWHIQVREVIQRVGTQNTLSKITTTGVSRNDDRGLNDSDGVNGNFASTMETETMESGNDKMTYDKLCSLTPLELLTLVKQSGTAMNSDNPVPPTAYHLPTVYNNKGDEITLTSDEEQRLLTGYENIYSETLQINEAGKEVAQHTLEQDEIFTFSQGKGELSAQSKGKNRQKKRRQRWAEAVREAFLAAEIRSLTGAQQKLAAPRLVIPPQGLLYELRIKRKVKNQSSNGEGLIDLTGATSSPKKRKLSNESSSSISYAQNVLPGSGVTMGDHQAPQPEKHGKDREIGLPLPKKKRSSKNIWQPWLND